MRRSSRIDFGPSAGLVFIGNVVLARRKVLARLDGDVTQLLLATVAGAAGLALLRAWWWEHER